MRYGEVKLSKQAYDGQASWAAGRNTERKQQQAYEQEMYNMPQAELHRLSKAPDTPLDVRRRVLAERKRRMQGGVYGEALQQARNTAPGQLNPTAFGAGDKINGNARTNAAAQVRREQAGIPQQARSGWASWQPYKAALEELGPVSVFKALPAAPVAVMRTIGKIPGAMYKLPAYTSDMAGKVIPGAVAALMYGHDAETAKAAWQGATENYDNSLLGMTMQNMHDRGNALDNRITGPMRYLSYLESTPGYTATMDAVEDMGASVGAYKLVSGAPGMVRDTIDAAKAKLEPVARGWLQRFGQAVKNRSDKIDRTIKLMGKLDARDIKQGNSLSWADAAAGNKHSATVITQTPNQEWFGKYSPLSIDTINDASLGKTLGLFPMKDANGNVVYYRVISPAQVYPPGGGTPVFDTTATQFGTKLPPEAVARARNVMRFGTETAPAGKLSRPPGVAVYRTPGDRIPSGIPTHEANGPMSHAANAASGRIGLDATQLDDTKLVNLVAPTLQNSTLGDELLAYSTANGVGKLRSLVGRSHYWNHALNNVALRWGPRLIDGYKWAFSPGRPVQAATAAGAAAPMAAAASGVAEGTRQQR